MTDATMHAGQFATLLIMAVALGMDAFSLGIGIGLKGIRLRDVLRLSTVIAVFHVIMPLAGMYAGHFVSGLLGHVATMAAGVLLLLLGGHMIYNSLRGEAAQTIDYRSSVGTFLFAFSVSIDSFSVGVTLGMFKADIVLTVLLFGFFGGLMSVLGLLLGRRVSQNLGGFGEALGGAILLIFGLLFIF
ncbi:putative manganese efflux pump MntP [Paenibacillus glycanilyticus]|uniref:Putative manganese efflux pump MntP n=1 Tax=Paenibacillus glycanilyticus TaxID=126569 RepID=A0ABQ6GL79_9BACL|nr:manganese efflux pump MntP family protein [Paenibacillus glycanilyticus]GLX70106.1 putative manganese efflux pump MntP [Paenibacillus glycanilyticus]